VNNLSKPKDSLELISSKKLYIRKTAKYSLKIGRIRIIDFLYMKDEEIDWIIINRKLQQIV